jgi:predicted kinase
MRQRLVLLVGLPGCGKSTWIERQGVTALSSDEMRRRLAHDSAIR